MDIVFILLPLTLLLALLGLCGFFWAVKRGQFDDVETPAVRILFEDADSITAKQNGQERRPQDSTENNTTR